MAHAYLKAPDLEVYQRCRKVPFESRAMALRALRNFCLNKPGVQHGWGVLNAYRCGICGGIHLGPRRI